MSETKPEQQPGDAAPPTNPKSLREQLNVPADPLWGAGVILSVLAIVSLLLPWVWIDDYPTALNAGQLFFFYPTSNEKWYLFRQSPLGSLTTIFATAYIIAAVLGNAALAIRRKPSGWLALSIIAAIADLLYMTTEILDPDRPFTGPFAAPETGLALLLISQTLVVGLSAYRRYRAAPAGARYRAIPFLNRAPAAEGATPAGKKSIFEW